MDFILHSFFQYWTAESHEQHMVYEKYNTVWAPTVNLILIKVLY